MRRSKIGLFLSLVIALNVPRGYYLSGLAPKALPNAFCSSSQEAITVAVCGTGDENWQRYFLGVIVKKSF